MRHATMKVMKDDVVVEEIPGLLLDHLTTDEEVVLQLDEGGVAHFPKDDDHWLELGEEVLVLPTDTTTVPTFVTPAAKPAKAPKVAATVVGKKVLKPGSPLETIVRVCQANPTLLTNRKEMLVKIKQALPEKTDGFISTYHQMAMKWLST